MGAEDWLLDSCPDKPERVVKGRGQTPVLVPNTISAPQDEGVAVSKSEAVLLRLYRRVCRYATLAATLNLSAVGQAEMTNLWQSITQGGVEADVDPWNLHAVCATLATQKQQARRQAWLEWVTAGTQKTGRLFR